MCGGDSQGLILLPQICDFGRNGFRFCDSSGRTLNAIASTTRTAHGIVRGIHALFPVKYQTPTRFQAGRQVKEKRYMALQHEVEEIHISWRSLY